MATPTFMVLCVQIALCGIGLVYWSEILQAISVAAVALVWVIKMCVLVAASIAGLFIVCGIGGVLLHVVLCGSSSSTGKQEEPRDEKEKCDEDRYTKVDSSPPVRRVSGDVIDLDRMIRQITNERKLKDVTRVIARFAAENGEWTIRGRIDVERRSFHPHEDDWEDL